jgi:hypothetical protein
MWKGGDGLGFWTVYFCKRLQVKDFRLFYTGWHEVCLYYIKIRWQDHLLVVSKLVFLTDRASGASGRGRQERQGRMETGGKRWDATQGAG